MHKHIHVTCAIIERDGLVIAAKCVAAMKMPYNREFPGGKIRPGETPELWVLIRLYFAFHW
ncbi:MAG: hypothetical protein K9J81_11530, partial [Desulfohalobiaceae bacterium]|nr:hypothetical protein [Desulfohalobiaceae bacterium]